MLEPAAERMSVEGDHDRDDQDGQMDTSTNHSQPPWHGTPPLNVQAEKIRAIRSTTQQKIGDEWYVVSMDWWSRWCQYVGYRDYSTAPVVGVPGETSHPGQIDNTKVLDPRYPSEVSRDAVKFRLFELLPKEAFDLLYQWYGSMQLPITGIVVEKRGQKEVELLFIGLRLGLKGQAPDTCPSMRFKPSRTKFGDLKELLCKTYNKPCDDTTRLWHLHKRGQPYKVLDDLDRTLQDYSDYIEDDEIIVLEEKQEGEWPESEGWPPGPYNRQLTPHSSPLSSGFSSPTAPARHRPGVCGLQNLGNTCFMNSALQCLSNTPPLTDYILANSYMAEINEKNPLGMRGEIALNYCHLVKDLWSGQHTSIAPRSFKLKLGQYQPRFSGYQQQDSQELLAFLLDGLHEDLNRVKQKPYIEMPDSDDQPEERKLAELSWEYHRKRNDSVIVDLFQGQFKSTLVCPTCGKRSITFDPFMYLSLPLPGKQRTVQVIVAPRTGPWVRYKVQVGDHASISALKVALSEKSGIPADKFVVYDVFQHKIYRELSNNDKLETIKDSDTTIAYEVATTNFLDDDWAVIRVDHRTESHHYSSSMREAAVPLLISVPRHKTTLQSLQQAVLNAVRQLCGPVRPQPVSVSVADADDPTAMSEDDRTDRGRQSVSPMGIDTPGSTFTTTSDGPGADAMSGLRLVFTKKIQYNHRPFTCPTDDRGNLIFPKEDYVVFAEWVRRDPSMAEFLDGNDKMPWIQDEMPDPVQQEGKESPVTLNDCLDLFTKQEQLGADDLWYCPKCKSHQQAYKKFDLWRLPRTLVVHLKRFSDSRWYRRKLDTFVDFPIEGLDLSKYMVSDAPHAGAMYDLHAVSNHMGGLGGGHYTAYAKNKVDGQWYNFDDASASLTSLPRIKSSSAYVLFYSRRDS
eukprot:comp17299_c0_seq1/m.16441 comp17299_c0_seq1/g.16441  ORF comp17299_c0_seq1/g.16441 comp17299_c0_seq1/m.16441 type:complete len:906 (-) comp17299_c0_seq1:89-2806(-)